MHFVSRIAFRQIEPETVLITWPELPDYVTGYFVRVKQISPEGPDLVQGEFLPASQLNYTIHGVQPCKKIT